MAHEMDIDGFLGHKTSGGGKSNYLGNWKNREGDKKRQPVPLPPKCVDTWLHRKCGIVSIWRHNLPRKVVRENKDTKEQETLFWSGNYVCHETEELLKQQFKRSKETGKREVPPKVCGICKFIEWVREQVIAGDLDWKDEVFRFEPDEGDVQVFHAGGLYGAFSGELDDSEKKELRAAKIFVKEAWKEKCMANANYVFRVVDHDNPEQGVQVAIQAALLGDKVKTVIGDAKNSLGTDEGNPLKHPYCIRWEHRPDEKEFQKKYHAVRMERLELSEEIETLITDTDPPDISNVTKPFDWEKVKAEMQEHCVLEVEVPWDDLFAAHEGQDKGEFDEDKPKAKSKSNGASNGKPASTSKKPESKKSKEPEEEQFACDECGKAMAASATTCPHCGHEYEVDEEEEKKPEPKKLPTRAEARAAAAAKAKAAEKPTAKKPPPPKKEEAEDDDDPEAVPF